MDDELENLSRYERRKILREQEKEKQKRGEAGSRLRNWTVGLLVIFGLFGGGYWYYKSLPEILREDIISRQGLHWHPELAIYIKGQKQEIPADIGIGAIHKPIHTHDSTGTIHMEMEGLVTKEDSKLSKFFEIWDKTFNSSCILEFCNGSEGTVKMTVNGQENKDYENYLMKDKDKIEIRYE